MGFAVLSREAVTEGGGGWEEEGPRPSPGPAASVMGVSPLQSRPRVWGHVCSGGQDLLGRSPRDTRRIQTVWGEQVCLCAGCPAAVVPRPHSQQDLDQDPQAGPRPPLRD